jgi:hypothetical protein
MSQQPHFFAAAQPGGFPYAGTAQGLPAQGAYQQSFVMMPGVQAGQPGQQGYAIQSAFPVHSSSYSQGPQRGIGEQGLPSIQYGQGMMVPHYQSAAGPGARPGFPQQVCMCVLKAVGTKIDANFNSSKMANAVAGFLSLVLQLMVRPYNKSHNKICVLYVFLTPNVKYTYYTKNTLV